MPNPFRLRHLVVYARTAKLRHDIAIELSELDNAYAQIQALLEGKDSATNAAFIEAMERNRNKARVAAETLVKLLLAIHQATLRFEREDQRIADTFAFGRGVY